MDPLSPQNALAAMGQAKTQAATRQLNASQSGLKPLDTEGVDARPQGRQMSEKELAAIEKSAKDFEAMVLGQMLQPMFAGLETDGPFGGGFSEEMYRSMLVDEYGRMMAENGGLGIADAVRRELLSIQEHAPARGR